MWAIARKAVEPGGSASANIPRHVEGAHAGSVRGVPITERHHLERGAGTPPQVQSGAAARQAARVHSVEARLGAHHGSAARTQAPAERQYSESIRKGRFPGLGCSHDPPRLDELDRPRG